MKLERLLEEYEVFIEVLSSKDEQSRCSLISYWRAAIVGPAFDEMGNRGQISLCKLEDKVQYWKLLGKTVTVLNNKYV